MIVQVQCYAGRKADERPVRFRIYSRITVGSPTSAVNQTLYLGQHFRLAGQLGLGFPT
jgi:hypothetical protein